MIKDNKHLQQARDYMSKKPYLTWDTTDYQNLSPESIVKRIVSYGNWDDFLYIKNLFGLEETKNAFNKLTNKKRTNIRPQTANYFTKYFKAHA